MLTIGEALTLPEWAGVTALTALSDLPGGPQCPLGAVQVLAGVRSPINEPGDALLVALPAEIARDDWLLDVLIRRVAAVGAAALLIGGKAPVSRATAQIARRLAVPILGADDVMAAAVALQVHLTLPELAAARWTVRVADACAASGSGVDDVIDAAARAVGRPIGLIDSVGNPVAGDVPVQSTRTPDEAAHWLRRPPAPDSEWVHQEVVTDHPRGAYLVLRRDPHDDLRATAAALRVLAVAVAGRLAMGRLAAERDARQRMSLISQLLQSGGTLSADAPRRMLDQGWRLDGHHVGIRIDVPTAMDPVALRPEVLSAFTETGLDAVVVEQGAGWLAWTSFAQPPTSAALQAHSSAIRRVQWLLRSHLPTVMGVGSLQSGPEGLVRSLGEAGDAARIATTRKAGGHLVQVDRLGLGQLLLAWTRTDTFAPAASSLLTPLQGQTGLLETLAAYLEAESSVADTAAELGVHRNTVSARIAKAVELLGVDLDDPDERLAVQLACRSVLSHR